MKTREPQSERDWEQRQALVSTPGSEAPAGEEGAVSEVVASLDSPMCREMSTEEQIDVEQYSEVEQLDLG